LFYFYSYIYYSTKNEYLKALFFLFYNK